MSSSKSKIMILQDPVLGQTFGDEHKKTTKSSTVPMDASYMGVEEFYAREKSALEPLLSKYTDKNLQQQVASNKCVTTDKKRRKIFSHLRLTSHFSALLGLMVAMLTIFSDVGVPALWMYSEYRSEHSKEALKMNLLVTFIWSLISTTVAIAISHNLISTLKAGYQMESNMEKEIREKMMFILEGSFMAVILFGSVTAWFLVDLFMGFMNKYLWLASTVCGMLNALCIYKYHSGVVEEIYMDGIFDITQDEIGDAKEFDNKAYNGYIWDWTTATWDAHEIE